MDKTRKIVENTLEEYDRKNGVVYHRKRTSKVLCFAKFLDKIKNETKNITIESYNIIGELNKIMQSSEGMYKLKFYKTNSITTCSLRWMNFL